MRFLTPIIQGIIIVLAASVLGGSIKIYGQFESVKARIENVEQAIIEIRRELKSVPLCRSK